MEEKGKNALEVAQEEAKATQEGAEAQSRKAVGFAYMMRKQKAHDF